MPRLGTDAGGDTAPRTTPGSMTEIASRIRSLSISKWGPARRVEMIGTSEPLCRLQQTIEKVARYPEAVLITGESGVGKESIAQSVYLLSEAVRGPFMSVNCPQFQEGNLTVSELFGHVKGSFTGAVADRRGAFEEADGGAIFLDEIGDLQPNAQAMLLRALATGEFTPVGSSRPRRVTVRVISATNRPLNGLALSKEFRYDLFFRLARFHLVVPPLRERGDDWMLLTEHSLAELGAKYGVRKRLSAASTRVLQSYHWPGNVRQLINMITTGYAMSDGDLIEPSSFAGLLENEHAAGAYSDTDEVDTLFHRVTMGGEDFWTVVYEQFMARNLNRHQVKTFIRKGLLRASHNYRNLLELLRLPSSDYQRFMDFLRHHDLKP